MFSQAIVQFRTRSTRCRAPGHHSQTLGASWLSAVLIVLPVSGETGAQRLEIQGRVAMLFLGNLLLGPELTLGSDVIPAVNHLNGVVPQRLGCVSATGFEVADVGQEGMWHSWPMPWLTLRPIAPRAAEPIEAGLSYWIRGSRVCADKIQRTKSLRQGCA